MSGPVEIVPARPADAAPCAAILSDWIERTAWMPRIHSRAQERAFLRDLIGRGWVRVARRDGDVVGFIARDGGEVHALYVAEGARGGGLGRRLLNDAKAARPALGLWTFQANVRAQAFYLREGFREVGRSDGAGNDEGLPDIRYEWSRQ